MCNSGKCLSKYMLWERRKKDKLIATSLNFKKLRINLEKRLLTLDKKCVQLGAENLLYSKCIDSSFNLVKTSQGDST